MIVTAGHCTYIKGDYASSIVVPQFPGEKFTRSIYQNGLYASPEYIKHGAGDVENDDYGLILIPKSRDVISGFGWSAWSAEDTELDECSVTSCGYPTDKPAGTLWITVRRKSYKLHGKTYLLRKRFDPQAKWKPCVYMA